MEIKPIEGFENDYAVSSNGTILDLVTNKIKVTYKRGNELKPRVDLYKNGELIISMYVIDIVIFHYVGRLTNTYYEITYKDGNYENCSIDNLVATQKNTYIPKKQIKKPFKKWELSTNGLVLINGDEIKEVINENGERTKIRQSIKKKLSRKIPVKGTPEREEHDEMMKGKKIIGGMLDCLKSKSERIGVNFNLTYDTIMNVYMEQKGLCVLTEIPLTLERKKNNTLKILVVNKNEDITKENILLIARKGEF